MKKQINKLIKRHVIPLILIFLLANTALGVIIFTRSKAENCMNQSQIDSDPRCLYVYQGYVYEKGTRQKPHKGKPCGINVDANIPNLHFVGNVLTKFNNAKVAPFCSNNPSPMPEAIQFDKTQISKPLSYFSLSVFLVSLAITLFL